MASDDYKTFSLRVPVEMFDRIKQDAITLADGNVNQYVLSWLPETYEQPTRQSETPAAKQQSSGR